VAAFVGSGLSIPLGIKSWDELLEDMAEEFDTGLDVKQLIFQKGYPKTASEIYNSIGNHEDYLKFLKSQFEPRIDLFSPKHLQIISFFRIILTTNFDSCIENACEFLGNRPNIQKLPYFDLLNLSRADTPTINHPHDLATSVLNSPKGKVFSAMVIYSLRYARVFSKSEKVRWPLSIKEEFDKRLNRNIEPSLDFSLTLGKYLANLAYLDMEWVESKINQIFLNDNENHWKAAIEGYLFYASTVHQELYLLLRENGHYEKALNTEFEDNHIKERLIQHICVGYIEDWENLEQESSLISQIINRNKANELSEIVSFFWMLRENPNDKIRSKVKQLWKALFENTADKVDNLEYQKILSNLSRWLVLVEEIDEEVYGWLKVSARYVKTDYNSSFFIEYLLKHVDKTPGRVGELFLEMPNSGAYPDYKKENIEEIVEKLYGKGEKEIADKICNSYGEKGIYFLRDIYEKHHAARLRSHSHE